MKNILVIALSLCGVLTTHAFVLVGPTGTAAGAPAAGGPGNTNVENTFAWNDGKKRRQKVAS